MLQFFRSSIKSRIGAIIGLVFLGVIALAFAAADITGGNFGGVAGGDKVATVDGQGIDTSVLNQGASAAFERAKERQPNLSMQAMIAQGGLTQILSDLIDRTALDVFGKKSGIVAGSRLIDSEVANLPAFQGADGKFSEDVYRQAMRQRGISESMMRDDIAQGLIVRQLAAPVQFGATMPETFAKRYAALLMERRTGSVAILPSLAFAPKDKPTEAQLNEFYKGHTDEFIRPERRVIRYSIVGADKIKAPSAPTDDEIAARYEANKAQYAAQDMRDLAQVIVPTEAAAKAFVAEVNSGKSLETAAREKGLAVAQIKRQTRAGIANQASSAVADAVFSTGKGQIAAPGKSPLGWHVIRIEAIESRPERPLAQVKAELAAEIMSEKTRAAFSSTLADIDEQFQDGASLADVAKSLGVQLTSSAPILADGNVYGEAGKEVPAELGAVVKTAFTMEQGEPQVAEAERGKNFVIYEVADIAVSAPAPLNEIKDDVTLAWALEKGSADAKAAGEKIQAAVRKGESLENALAGLGKPMPPIENLGMTRADLAMAQQQGRAVPPPVSLMFNMAKGTVKVQPAPGQRGWFVVQLKDIEAGKVEDDDPMIAAAQRSLSGQLGEEYWSAFRKSVRSTMTVKRNEAAIKAVSDQLTGTSSPSN